MLSKLFKGDFIKVDKWTGNEAVSWDEYNFMLSKLFKGDFIKVEKWTGNEAVSINTILNLLNEAFKIDPEFMQNLITTRFPCNKTFTDHPTIQVHCYGDSSVEQPKAGFLGILNGMLGIDENISGPIAANFDEDQKLMGFILTNTEAISARIKKQEEDIAKKKEEGA